MRRHSIFSLGAPTTSVSSPLRELIHHIIAEPTAGTVRQRLEGVILDQLASSHTVPLELPQVSDLRVREIADALQANPCDRRTLREFGADVGASERTLQRLFAAETGTTFGRWRTQLRLQHAVIELGIGSSVTTAATMSGYREVSAFIEAFRNAFGTTPGRYFSDPESHRQVPVEAGEERRHLFSGHIVSG